MNVVVVGGGNSTSIFATLSKLAGHTVSILTRRPSSWSSNRVIGFINQDKGYLEAQRDIETRVDCITSDASSCIPNADFILLAGMPIHHHPEVLSTVIGPNLDRRQHQQKKKVFIGSICTTGGFHWAADRALRSVGVTKENKDYSLFGTQLIPWFCGTEEYGRRGVVYGAKRVLRVATEGGKDKDNVTPILAHILQMPFLTQTDFLASTLWPNNPSLHPPILYGLFKDWDGNTPYRKIDVPERLYRDLTDESARYVHELDIELTRLVSALARAYPRNPHLQKNFGLSHCILENYADQVTDGSDIASVIRSNKAFASHTVPYTEVTDELVVPTLTHKFFETDLPFGLCTWKDMADMVGVDMPLTMEIIYWNQKLIGKEYLADDGSWGRDMGECVLPSVYGIGMDCLE